MQYVYIVANSEPKKIIEVTDENISLSQNDNIVSRGKLYTVLYKVYNQYKKKVTVMLREDDDDDLALRLYHL